MIIRHYQCEDLEPFTELMADLGYPTDANTMRKRLEKIHSNSMYNTFVAVWDDGKIVGMVGVRQLISYETDKIVTQISALVTKKEYRNKGIGKALVKHVEEWALANHSNMIYLTSGNREDRLQAHAFYRSLGFEMTGLRFVKRLK